MGKVYIESLITLKQILYLVLKKATCQFFQAFSAFKITVKVIHTLGTNSICTAGVK